MTDQQILRPSGSIKQAAGSVSKGTPANPPPQLAPIVYSTKDVVRCEQFAAWRDSNVRIMDLHPLSGDVTAGFAATREIWRLGPFVLERVRAPAARFWRTPEQARRSGLDHWLISLMLRGTRRTMTFAGGISEQRPGRLHVTTLAEAFESERTNVEWLGLFVPRDAFPELGPSLEAARRCVPHGPLSELLAAHLRALADGISDIALAEVPYAVSITRAALAAGTAPLAAGTAGGVALADLAGAAVVVARVKAIVRRSLGSASLGPERLCREVCVSRSKLYRLFEPFGGVARYVQAERLQAAHRALSDPSDGRTIVKIAEDVGMFDASTFSRIFRREFGVSPRELRAAALSGSVGAAASRYELEASRNATDLADVLRRL